ncbi:MAG: integrase arm-type DNA-binding domain-containing protein [Caulobacterales bacterium]
MPNLRLTEISVRALNGSDSYMTYWDTTTPGFGVRVGKRSKTWTVMRGRNRERISVGKVDDLSLSDARKEAKRLLAAESEEKPLSMTFEAARTTFLEDNYKDRSPRTTYQVKRSLERHFKALEPMQLTEITDAGIKRALDKLADRRSEQLHAYRYLRTFFRWCMRPPRRYIRHSPMDGYDPPSRDKKGSRVLTDAELKAIWKASKSAPHAIFRLMVLWGTRNTETAVLERAWARDGVLTIPGEFTKNGRDHAIPVLPVAQSVLDDRPNGNARHFFPGRWGEGHLHHGALGKLKREVMTASKTEGWQLRDLRRTFRSNMARLKVPREVCEVLINHAPPVLDEIYDRYDRLEEKREALAKYEAFIQTLIA